MSHPMRGGLLQALRELGPIGEEAAKHIENQRESLRISRAYAASLTDGDKHRAEAAERQVRDQAREIQRLNREVAELKSGPLLVRAKL